MANKLLITGTLTSGPSSSEDGVFPAGSDSTPLYLNPSPKPAAVNSGIRTRNMNSAGAYVALSGIGVADDVTQGTFLYLRTKVAMMVKLIVSNGAGGTVTLTGLPINGLFIMEFDAAKYLVGVEVQGVGQIEIYASGNL